MHPGACTHHVLGMPGGLWGPGLWSSKEGMATSVWGPLCSHSLGASLKPRPTEAPAPAASCLRARWAPGSPCRWPDALIPRGRQAARLGALTSPGLGPAGAAPTEEVLGQLISAAPDRVSQEPGTGLRRRQDQHPGLRTPERDQLQWPAASPQPCVRAWGECGWAWVQSGWDSPLPQGLGQPVGGIGRQGWAEPASPSAPRQRSCPRSSARSSLSDPDPHMRPSQSLSQRGPGSGSGSISQGASSPSSALTAPGSRQGAGLQPAHTSPQGWMQGSRLGPWMSVWWVSPWPGPRVAPWAGCGGSQVAHHLRPWYSLNVCNLV